MRIFLSIDDTDSLDSPGSGQLAEDLAHSLREQGLVSEFANISRHQLYVHKAIPYTSHNSSMCFAAVTPDNRLRDIIAFAGQYLQQAAAKGSDPGLCVAVADELLDREALTAFGVRAKQTVLTKQEAYALAEKTGVHLSEHGGTGDGIIGALAGTGLRLQGNDGRFRGWLKLGEKGQTTTPGTLCSHPLIEAVIDDHGQPLAGDIPVLLADDRLKTILHNHRQVIPVTARPGGDSPAWTTLSREEVKLF